MKQGFVMGFWQAAGALVFTALVTVGVTTILLSLPASQPGARASVKRGCGA